MTTTIIPFAQPAGAPFQFGCTLDGQSYTVTVPWNLWARRYYVTVWDGQGNVVLNIARVGSPRGHDISLVAGYFTTKLVWREPDVQFEVIEP